MQTWSLKQYLVRIWQGSPLPNSKEELAVIDNFDATNFSEVAIDHINDIFRGVCDHITNVTQAEREIMELVNLERIRISRLQKTTKV